MFMLETNPCMLVFTISLTLEKAVTAAEFGDRLPLHMGIGPELPAAHPRPTQI